MNTSGEDAIAIEVILNSSIENVWNAWTDPAQLHWFGSDPKGKLLNANLDVRTGGLYEITFRDADQTEHTCSGIYKEVQKFRRLSFTWMWKSEPGVESQVTVQLTPAGNSTRMQFEHAQVGTASMHNYLVGWKTTFLKLERMLAGL